MLLGQAVNEIVFIVSFYWKMRRNAWQTNGIKAELLDRSWY